MDERAEVTETSCALLRALRPPPRLEFPTCPKEQTLRVGKLGIGSWDWELLNAI